MNLLSVVGLSGFFLLSMVLQTLCESPLVEIRKGEKKQLLKMLKPRLPTLTEDTISKNPVIVGGMPADYGQFPHQALLKIDDSYVCGGSLIGSKWILTAAHCALERYMFEIYCGSVSWRLYSETSIWTTVSYTAIVHENYNPSLLSNDIAVIKLTTSAPSNKYIRIIGLPSFSDTSKSLVGEKATASGWGWTRNNGLLSNTLMWVTMPIISNAECSKTFQSKYITSKTMCTSGTGLRSTCRGDSGGALIFEDNGVKKQVGIVSFGTVSCQSGTPQGYTRVTAFLQWISDQTGITIKN